MESFEKIPMIVALGKTGAGKSTILNNISGGMTYFRSDSCTESITEDYTLRQAYWAGDRTQSKIQLYDTIGFEDNRSIDALFTTKTQTFLENLSSGVDVVLIVVPVNSSLRDCYLQPVQDTLNLLGENVVNNILLVMTQTNMLNDQLQKKYRDQYSPLKIKDSLNMRGICIKMSQIMIYENNEDDTKHLITQMKDIICYSQSVIPETSKLIIENLDKEPEIPNYYNIRDTTIIYVAEKLHKGLKMFMKNTINKFKNLNHEAITILKLNKSENKSQSWDFSDNSSVVSDLNTSANGLDQNEVQLVLLNLDPQIAEIGNENENSNIETIENNNNIHDENNYNDENNNNNLPEIQQIDNVNNNQNQDNNIPNENNDNDENNNNNPPEIQQIENANNNQIQDNNNNDGQGFEIIQEEEIQHINNEINEQRNALIANARRNRDEYRRYKDPYKTGFKAACTGGKVAIEVGLKTGNKVAAKVVQKSTISIAGKKVPILGAVIGLGFGIARFCKGEIVKGFGEIASGAASCFPGPGTGISLALDTALVSHDIYELKKSSN